jgi:histidyl-tRNA synthetase
VADAETAQVIYTALSCAGVPDFTIALNNRKVLDGLLESLGIADRKERVLRALDKMAKAGREAVASELQKPVEEGGAGLTGESAGRVLAFAAEGRGGVEVLDAAERSQGSNARAAQGLANLRDVLALLVAANVPPDRIVFDLGMARGLDYYTGVVFETTVDGWERFGSVASGGRYDDLASLFTSRRLPGVGASIGLDRLLALMDEAGALAKVATTTPVLVANFLGVDAAVAVRIAVRLRAAGFGAEVYPDPISVGKQMGYGSSRGHKVAVIVGPDEQPREVFVLRNLATRVETKEIPLADLEDVVAHALKADAAPAHPA